MRCALVAPVGLVAALAAALAAAPRAARAEPNAAPNAAPRAAPNDLVARPLGLARGEVEARLVAALSLGRGAFAAPVSLSPDAWLGVAPRWTVGIVHSRQSLGLIEDGAALCFRGRPPLGCDRVYTGGGVDVRWSWREGALAVAPRARLVVRGVDPWKPALTAGALARWTRGRFAVTGDPYLRLGLANRDRGNRAALVVPLWLAVQPAGGLMVALHAGWDSELAVARDGWHGPLGLAAEARVAARVHVAVEGGFRSLIGPQADAKTRALAIWLAWRP